jgi:hypothetical protein
MRFTAHWEACCFRFRFGLCSVSGARPFLCGNLFYVNFFVLPLIPLQACFVL